MAHHRKDIIAPGSDYYENLKAAIIAEKGSFFGGWSRNVLEWTSRSAMIIRFEDLISDPIGCTERLRAIMELPQPRKDRLPGFLDLKHGTPEYGSGKNRGISQEEMQELSQKNFRKGKAGGWKEEMPMELHDLFWSYHGDTMDMLGYGYDGKSKALNPDFDREVMIKLGQEVPRAEKKYHILMEAGKLLSPDNDGVKRYQAALLRAMLPLAQDTENRWQIDLWSEGTIRPLKDFSDLIRNDFNKKDTGAAGGVKPLKKSLFQRFEEMLVSLVPGKFVEYLQRRNIRFFHRAYEFLKKMIFAITGVLILPFRYGFKLLYNIKAFFQERADSKGYSGYHLIHLPLMQHYRPFRKALPPILVTMHDLTHRFFPDYHTPVNISNAEKGLRFAEKKDAWLIAVSASTKSDLLNHCRFPEEKIRIIHEAADREKFNYRINTEDTARVREKYGIPVHRPYFLCLSTIEPRKNLENIIRAFTLLMEKEPNADVSLVIAGKKGWASDRMFLHNKLLSERILFTGFIDDEDLPSLYSDALALCYVSYYEGFGLPLLEAMTCMTPVIYGNNSSMPEVAGDGGLAADPGDAAGIMEQMHSLLYNKELRDKLKINALRRSSLFSWRKAAKETLSWYEKIIEVTEKQA